MLHVTLRALHHLNINERILIEKQVHDKSRITLLRYKVTVSPYISIIIDFNHPNISTNLWPQAAFVKI